MSTAHDMIATLGLQPHPEGGFYRETWRAIASDGGRPSSTAILYLLRTGERSHWHTVDADEIWLWQDGDALYLDIAEHDDAAPQRLILGPDHGTAQSLQGIVPQGQWQAAEPVPGPHGYALVSCVVAPGFDFAGFRLAAPGWNPGQ